MKIGPVTIILIGIALAVCAISYGLFHNWMPKNEEIANKEAELQALRDQNLRRDQVDKKVADAKAEVRSKAELWKQVVATNTPPSSVEAGGINLAVSAYQLTVDSQRFRDSIQRAVNAQLKRGGVRVVNGPFIPPPTDDPASILPAFYNFPNPYPFPVVVFNLGGVTVTGTYSQIMANVRSWRNMPNYLAVADGLAITGTSPRLTGTYNVSIVGFIKATRTGPPAVIGAAATGPAGG